MSLQLGAIVDALGGELHGDAALSIERLAPQGDPARFVFPRPLRDEQLDFSFSGLKTAVLHAVRKSPDLDADRAHLARGFQDAALDVLVTKLERAVRQTGRNVAVLGGGVGVPGPRKMADMVSPSLAR